MIQRFLAALRAVRFGHLALAGCLAFSACADMTNMTSAQQAIEQSKRRFIATTAEGAVAGALLGALIGGLAGGGRQALIGAAAGGVAGTVAGYAVAQNNFQRNNNEGNLNAAIADASQQAAQARKDASFAQQIASDARARSASLRGQFRAGQITAVQYKTSMQSFQTSLRSLQEMSKGYTEQIAQMRQNASVAQGPGGARLYGSSSEIEQAKDATDRATADLLATISAEPA